MLNRIFISYVLEDTFHFPSALDSYDQRAERLLYDCSLIIKQIVDGCFPA
jgi:hypothetical protein